MNPHFPRHLTSGVLRTLICSLLITPSLAQIKFKPIPNGFDNLKWGASEQEVRDVKSKLLPVFQEPVGDKKNILTRFFPDPTTAQFFFFVDGKLRAVALHPRDQSDFLRISQKIKTDYGDPTKHCQRNITLQGKDLSVDLALWNGSETDIQLSLITSGSDKVIASIAYLEPDARATTNFVSANPFYLEIGLGIQLPEFGKAYESLDWGSDFETVASQYSGIKFQSRDSSHSLVTYEGFGSDIPYSRRFVFAQNKLLGVVLQLTNEQVKLVYGSRIALIEKLALEYGKPRQEPSLTHPIVEGHDWFSERYDLVGNDNTSVSIDFRRPIQVPDPGNNAFAIARVVYYAKGIVEGF